ncbi:MAG: TetR/AcrR family transcriptional regulator [Campylobacter sp.]|nr:TetR/AcrR family transcriptional regulator [Campylobacter sp.]
MAISKKGQRRYEAIIDAALELFLEKGYEKTSLNDIVKKSGGSLSSIYKFFESKDKLFATIIFAKFEEFSKEIKANEILQNTNDMSEFLNNFGLAYLELFFKPGGIELTRIIMSETYKNKEIVKLFSQSNSLCILQSFFERKEVKSRIKDYDSRALASKFFAIIREPFLVKNIILGEELAPLCLSEKKKMVAQAVDMFVNGIKKPTFKPTFKPTLKI